MINKKMSLKKKNNAWLIDLFDQVEMSEGMRSSAEMKFD